MMNMVNATMIMISTYYHCDGDGDDGTDGDGDGDYSTTVLTSLIDDEGVFKVIDSEDL